MGGGGLGERENAVNDGLEAAGGHEAHYAVKLRFRAHIGAEKRELAAEKESQVDLGLVAGGGAAGDQAASGGKAGEAVIPSGCTDVLENNIDAPFIGDAADFVADFLRFVVDEMVGAELFGFLQFFIGADGSDDARAEKFGDLNGGAANAAACSKDENVLAGLELGSRKKHVPSGLEDEWNRSSFLEGEVFRIRQAVDFRGADKLGAAAVNHVAEVGGLTAVVIKAGYASGALATANQWCENDFLANAYGGDVRADLRDFTGDVAAGNVRKRNRDARDAAADPEVEVVQRAGLYANEDFIRADDRVEGVGVFQDVGRPVLMKDDGFHERTCFKRSLGTLALRYNCV